MTAKELAEKEGISLAAATKRLQRAKRVDSTGGQVDSERGNVQPAISGQQRVDTEMSTGQDKVDSKSGQVDISTLYALVQSLFDENVRLRKYSDSLQERIEVLENVQGGIVKGNDTRDAEIADLAAALERLADANQRDNELRTLPKSNYSGNARSIDYSFAESI